MKFFSSVIIVSLFCGIQQFSQILCDDTVLNSTIPAVNATANGTDCEGISCILDTIMSILPFGSSSDSGNGYDGYDDYYGSNSGYDYDYNSAPIIEEIIIVPMNGSGSALENMTGSWPSLSGWDYGDYNASLPDSGSDNDTSSSSAFGGLFGNDGLLGGLFGSGSSDNSGSASDAINSTSAPNATAPSTSAPGTTTTTSVPPSLFSQSASAGSGSASADYGSGSAFAGSGSANGPSASASGAATSTSAPITSATAANATVSDNSTMTSMPATDN